jgi:hypothetical protein
VLLVRVRHDRAATHALRDGLDLEATLDVCDERAFLRLACLEQLIDARQTARDVAALRARLGHAAQDLSEEHRLVVVGFAADDGAGRQRVVRQQLRVAVRVLLGLRQDEQLRMPLFAVLRDNHHPVFGFLVDVEPHRHVLDDVLVLQIPSTSAMMGEEVGSHCTMRSSRDTRSRSFLRMRAP